MGLRKNICKTVRMVCRLCQLSGVWADEAYIRQMIGEGRSFNERQWEWVLCPDFRKELAKGSLVAYRQTQHGVAKGGLGQVGDKEARGGKPRIYRI